MTNSTHNTADVILQLTALKAQCDELEHEHGPQLDLAHLRSEIDVMLGDFEHEYLVAGVEERELIAELRSRLLWLDSQYQCFE